jgi:3-hydroxypropanoate dehydrogenase
MNPQVDDAAFDVLFRNARTQNGFLPKPLPDDLLRRIYDVAKFGPTSMNTQPMRVVFLRTAPAKERLVPALSPGNVDKVRQAPVTAIIATDSRFYDNMPTVWHGDGAKEMFAGNLPMADATATRNSTLQGAYLMLAARGLGVDCGPMSGFDPAKVNAEFFADGRFKVNFLCNFGYGDPSKLFDRNRRLGFDEACSLL